MHTESTLIDTRDQLVADIRSYSESQASLWQRVPLLSVRADGRDGGMGGYSITYNSGLWSLEPAKGLYSLYIDCESGRIVRPGVDRFFRAAPDYDVLKFAFSLEYLDAQKVIDRLTAKANSPRPSWISPDEAERREEERQRIVVSLSLGEVYVRPAHLKAA